MSYLGLIQNRLGPIFQVRRAPNVSEHDPATASYQLSTQVRSYRGRGKQGAYFQDP